MVEGDEPSEMHQLMADTLETAIGEIRPTLTAAMLAEFERGKEEFARL